MKKTSYKAGKGKANFRTFYHGNRFANGVMKGLRAQSAENIIKREGKK